MPGGTEPQSEIRSLYPVGLRGHSALSPRPLGRYRPGKGGFSTPVGFELASYPKRELKSSGRLG